MIRPARVSDAAELASLHIATWQHTYRGIFPEHWQHDFGLKTGRVILAGSTHNP